MFSGANFLGDPTDGHPDLHFTGVGLVSLAQGEHRDSQYFRAV